MYHQFYGLEMRPFEITPDPRFLYATNQYKEALATMLYGVKERKGLMVLTGEVGTGKTLLIRSLLQMLNNETRTAYVFNPRLDLPDFFGAVAAEFGFEGDLSTKGKFLSKLNAFLLELAQQKKTAVLIVDESQNLSLPILEEIRLLMNLETSNQKLIQVILSGQPELHRIINFNCMRQFKQRVSLRCHLNPLNRNETSEYITKRLQVAGNNGKTIFTSAAVRRIYKHSRGIPRLINVVCDNAMLTGYALEKKQIAPNIVKEVIGDLEGSEAIADKKGSWPRDETELRAEWIRPEKRKNARLRWVIGGGIVLVLLALVWVFGFQHMVPESLSRSLYSIWLR
jgi:general secretion pathway protein A